jgi:cytochrome b
VRGPRAVLAWLRGGAPTRLGHNPLGALSVVAMLALLLAG